jgi:hypothetical protein
MALILKHVLKMDQKKQQAITEQAEKLRQRVISTGSERSALLQQEREYQKTQGQQGELF